MRGQDYGVRHFKVSEPKTLIDFLTDSLSHLISEDRLRELIDLGSIYAGGKRVSAENLQTLLPTHTDVRVHLEPRRFQDVRPLAPRITFQDASYLIIDKPSGLPVHALVDNKRENLIAFLEEELQSKLYVTHRLDVDTTGLVILAKSPEAQTEINAKFQSGSVKRAYLALTETEVAVGTYVHFMEQSPKAPKRVQTLEFESSLRCELRVVACRKAVVLDGDSDADRGGLLQTSLGKSWQIKGAKPPQAYELEIELVTGRTHQIRSQLSALGAPIIGDTLYGSGFLLNDTSTFATAIALWAFKIQTTPDEKILRTS